MPSSSNSPSSQSQQHVPLDPTFFFGEWYFGLYPTDRPRWILENQIPPPGYHQRHWRDWTPWLKTYTATFPDWHVGTVVNPVYRELLWEVNPHRQVAEEESEPEIELEMID